MPNQPLANSMTYVRGRWGSGTGRDAGWLRQPEERWREMDPDSVTFSPGLQKRLERSFSKCQKPILGSTEPAAIQQRAPSPPPPPISPIKSYF